MAELFEPIPHLKGEKVSKAELSHILGVPISELDVWVRKGCPCRRTGAVRSALEFDSAQAIAWYVITTVTTERGATAGRMLRLHFERDALEAALHKKR